MLQGRGPWPGNDNGRGVDLDLLAETVAAVPVEDYLASYEQARDSRG
ncbi:MAG TPA: hypothetical protein VLC50_06550 [Actinomycetes bacterium]|nr:hypothetical protein [Actinomycetes bacterium]